MQAETHHVESLAKKASEYAETRLQLLKLRATDKSADIVSGLASRLILVIFLSIFIIILNIGIALWLGDLLGKNYYGFFVLAGFYGLCGLIFSLFKEKWVRKPISDNIIKKMTKDEYN
jgi:hypothetical protein